MAVQFLVVPVRPVSHWKTRTIEPPKASRSALQRIASVRFFREMLQLETSCTPLIAHNGVLVRMFPQSLEKWITLEGSPRYLISRRSAEFRPQNKALSEPLVGQDAEEATAASENDRNRYQVTVRPAEGP